MCWIVGYWCPFSISVSLISIRRSTPLTILRLRNPVLEFTYVTTSSSLPSTIESWVLTPRSINWVIKVMCMYCDTIAIGDTSYRYELVWSQLSTNRFVSPRASESALSYTHHVRNGLTIAANDRSLNITTLYWSQISSNLQLSCFAIYWMESNLRHSRHMNPMCHFPRLRRCGRNEGWFLQVHLVDRALIYGSFISDSCHIWLCISRDGMVVW